MIIVIQLIAEKNHPNAPLPEHHNLPEAFVVYC